MSASYGGVPTGGKGLCSGILQCADVDILHVGIYTLWYLLFLRKERLIHMLKQLTDMVARLDEAIESAEVSDMAYTKFYRDMCRQRKALKRAIKVFERTYR